MKNSLAIVLALCGPAGAVDFDGGVDASALLQQARGAASQSGYGERVAVRGVRFCRDIVVKGDGGKATEPVWVETPQFEERCAETCWSRPIESYRQRFQLLFAPGREFLPWESETFEACAEGKEVATLKPKSAAYRYEIKQDERELGNFYLTPGEKLPTEPDPDGVELSLWRFEQAVLGTGAATMLIAEFKDRWARIYAEETTEYVVELWRERGPLWRDDKVDTFKQSFVGTNGATIGVDKGLLRKGGKYYVKWGFRRLGPTSKDTFVNKGRSETILVD